MLKFQNKMSFHSTISASLLSADFSRLGEESDLILNAGADWLHFDIMDNHYVPNLTMGPLVVESLRKYGIKADFDVHLMVEPVDELILRFAKAGANWISFHPEASRHIDRSLCLIRDQGCKACLALNPTTSLDHLDYIMDKLDMILVMSVNPGFSGQKFIPSALAKIQAVYERIKKSGFSIRLQVDGGLNAKNINEAKKAGADTFVIGSAIFESKDYSTMLNTFRACLREN